MKTYLHLLQRELLDQRYFFIGSLVIGFAPYLVAPFATSHTVDMAEARAAVARASLLGFILAAPAVLGARWLVADFASGRRSFELARPLSAWQLCFSKLSAMLLLVLGGMVLFALPTGLAGLRLDPAPAESLQSLWLADQRALGSLTQTYQVTWTPFNILFLPYLALAAWLIFTLAQSLSLAVMTRSWRGFLDLGAWLFFVFLLGLAFSRFHHYGALGIAFSWVLPLGMAVGGLGLIGAWRSMGAGSLIDHGHRRFAAVMNFGLVALAAFTTIGAFAITRPDPARLREITLALPSQDGSHWLLQGIQDARGFAPSFLVDLAARQATYLHSLPPGLPLQLSRDGKRIFSATEGGGNPSFYEYSGGSMTRLAVLTGPQPIGSAAQPDPNGELLVWASSSGDLTVVELANPIRQLHHRRVEELQGMTTLVVQGPDRHFDLLVYNRNSHEDPCERVWTVQRFRLDAASGELLRGQTWTYPKGAWPQGLNLPSWWQETLPLLDAGMPFAELATQPTVRFLAGGFAVLRNSRQGCAPADASGPDESKWRIVDSSGATISTIDTPVPAWAVGEIRPGLLLMVAHPRQDPSSSSDPSHQRWSPVYGPQTLVVEAPGGKIVRTLSEYVARKVGHRVFLVDRNGAPYDLASAEADPQPILPWQPLGDDN